MNKTRRRLLLAAAGSCAAAISAPSFAAPFASKTITLVVPYSAGGPADILARIAAPLLSQKFGQAVIVENRAGADTAIAAQYVSKAEPDGNTLLFGGSEANLTPAIKKGVPIDATKALASVAGLYSTPFLLLVQASMPAQNLKEFVEYARKNPGKLNYGSSSVNSLLAMEAFKHAAGIDMVHIPYKGGAPLTNALLAQEVDTTFFSLSNTRAHIQAGKLRALAISGPARLKEFPNVPTLKQAGYDVAVAPVNTISAPAGTPPDVIARINQAVADVSKSKSFLDACDTGGMVPLTGTPDEIRKRVLAEIAQWEQIAKAIKYVPE